MKIPKNKTAIILIIFLSILLRALGLWHDYPYSFYPDEAHFVKRALSFGSFDFNPHWFHKPAFFMYILFVEYGIFFILGKIIGWWHSTSDFAISYIINPGPFYILGRIAAAAFGVATVYVTYLIGEKHFRKNVGLVGALLLALTYAHVNSSQDIKADIPSTFFAVLSALFMLKFLKFKYQQGKYIIWAAAFAGVGTATKLYPEIMMVPILGAIILTKENVHHGNVFKKKYLTLLYCMLIFCLFYFICSPYSFIDPLGREAVFHDVIMLCQKISGLWNEAPIANRPDSFISHRNTLGQGILNYTQVLFTPKGMGQPISLITFFGLLYMLIKPNKQNILFLLFPFLLAALSVYTAPGYAEPRHQLPIYPFLSIAGGIFLVGLTENLRPQNKTAIYILLLIILCWPLLNIIERGLFVSKRDTRNLAKDWIEKNIPAESKILVDENGPQLLASKKVFLKELEKSQKAARSGQFTAHYDKYLSYQLLAAERATTYDITDIRFPWWRDSEIKAGVHELDSDYDRDMANPLKPVGVNSFQWHVENGYQYAIIHSGKYETYLKNDSTKAQNFPSFAKFYKDLFAKGKLIKEFSPQDGNRPGPTVKIFQFNSVN